MEGLPMSMSKKETEEFTKRVLRPLDEDKFEFLVRQGYDINMVLRLMARGIAIDDERASTVLFNAPSQGEGTKNFVAASCI